MGSRGPLPGGRSSAAPPKVPGKLPGAPGELSDVARAEYARVSKLLKDSLTSADHGLLVMYCQAFGEVVGHEAIFTDGEDAVLHGSKGAVLNPRVRAMDMAAMRMERSAKLLGLTPEARIRLGAGTKQDDDEKPLADPDAPVGPRGFGVIQGNA